MTVAAAGRAQRSKVCYRRRMGHWGIEPWENDAAADWLDDFSENTRLAERIETGLSLPLEQIDAIRAASFLLLTFGTVGAPLVRDCGRLAQLAVRRLSEAIESGAFTNPQFVRRLVSELARLRNLEARSGQDSSSDPISAEISRVASDQFGLTLYDVTDIEGRMPAAVAEDIVGTGFLDETGVLHVQLEDGRDGGFKLSFRCVPDASADSDDE